MKFGGTSVGKPHRMYEVANLVTKDSEPKIVVLSAVSGTTNNLVEIGAFLSAGKKTEAKEKIDALHHQYQSFITELLKTTDALAKAQEVLKEHFEFLNIILRISYNEALNKDILAQGELLSTKLFSIYFCTYNAYNCLASINPHHAKAFQFLFYLGECCIVINGDRNGNFRRCDHVD